MDSPENKGKIFDLRNNAEYRVRVFQTAYTNKEGDSSVDEKRDITLSSEQEEVTVTRSTHSIAGRYDLYQFHLRTKSSSISRNTSLHLQVNRSKLASPSVEIPIRVHLGWLGVTLKVVSIIVFIAGILLIFGSDRLEGYTVETKELLERLGVVIAIIGSQGIGSLARTLLDKVQYQI